MPKIPAKKLRRVKHCGLKLIQPVCFHHDDQQQRRQGLRVHLSVHILTVSFRPLLAVQCFVTRTLLLYFSTVCCDIDHFLLCYLRT